MSDSIKNLAPKSLWSNFYSLTQIPRPSKKEHKAAEFVKTFGEELGLKTIMDDAGNVVISKPATAGYENRKGLILQAHIDMVPQSNANIVFDFEKDAIQTYIDGEWVKAKGTTLGADNGIGVAAALAVLQANDVEHGPLEVLVTVDEETGMTGAFALGTDVLTGEILINLDSEDENDISVGCAGGMNVNFEWQYNEVEVPRNNEAFKVSITGLKGGHSGLDIHLGRGNACKMMGHFLKRAIGRSALRLVSLNCGNMRNAIPREAFAIVTVPESETDDLQWVVAQMQAELMNELGRTEPDLSIKAQKIEAQKLMLPSLIQSEIINAMCGLPNGIMRLSDSMPGVVETSSNLSIVKTEKGKAWGMCLVRSFVDTARNDIASSLESCLQLAGAKVTFDGQYPGWKPNPDSDILSVMQQVFMKMKVAEPNVVAMHAGLECGILGAKYPNWDMVSVGPTIRNPHSPDEKVHIKSVENFWLFLVETLKNVPQK